MAKSQKQIEARNLRGKGESIKEIAKRLKVSKSSVSIWCRNIELSPRQIQKLHRRMVMGSYIGRLKGARIQKERREQKIKYYIEQGAKEIGKLNEKEMFLAGLCIYWGEGSRKSPAVRISNSDPYIIKFLMNWFRQSLTISDDRFLMYVLINQIHKKRLKEVVEFWSRLTNIPANQFREPTLIKAKSKKKYNNFHQHYGTLCIRIAKSTELFYQILGWVKALGNFGRE